MKLMKTTKARVGSKATVTQRIAVLATILGMTLGLTLPAVAGWAQSSYGWYTVAGETYKNHSGIGTNNSWDRDGVLASASTQVADGGNVEAGWMRARASLYRSSGQLVAHSNWRYNGSDARYVSSSVVREAGQGAYYAKGLTSAWDGTSRYKTYFTFRTPNQNQWQ